MRQPVCYWDKYTLRMVWYGAMHYGAVWCAVVRCAAVRCGAVRYGTVRCGVVQCAAVRCATVRCAAVWCSVVRCGVVHCGAVQCAAVRYLQSFIVCVALCMYVVATVGICGSSTAVALVPSCVCDTGCKLTTWHILHRYNELQIFVFTIN